MSNEQTNVLTNENKKKLKESKFHTVFYIICVVFFPLTGLINFCIWTLTTVKYIALGLGFLTIIVFIILAILGSKLNKVHDLLAKELKDFIFKSRVDTIFGLADGLRLFFFYFHVVYAILEVSVLQSVSTTN